LNDNGIPVATITKDITITWENGDVVMIQGERQREWIEGFGDRICENHYSIDSKSCL
jgi:leucyl aminopeptidase (aminopeptidase T)